MSAPTYAYAVEEIMIYAGDEELTGERFAFRLATRALPESLCQVMTGRARLAFLDGSKRELWLEGADLSELAAAFRERVRREGPTSVAVDVKAALRELVDERARVELG